MTPHVLEWHTSYRHTSYTHTASARWPPWHFSRADFSWQSLHLAWWAAHPRGNCTWLSFFFYFHIFLLWLIHIFHLLIWLSMTFGSYHVAHKAFSFGEYFTNTKLKEYNDNNNKMLCLSLYLMGHILHSKGSRWETEWAISRERFENHIAWERETTHGTRAALFSTLFPLLLNYISGFIQWHFPGVATHTHKHLKWTGTILCGTRDINAEEAGGAGEVRGCLLGVERCVYVYSYELP